jgi:glutathione synthase
VFDKPRGNTHVQGMRFLFVVNDALDVQPKQSTAVLIDGVARRGHAVFVCGVTDLVQTPEDRILAQSRPYAVHETLTEGLAALEAQAATTVDVGAMDRVILRTNPGRDDRDWAHDTALRLLDTARLQGAVVRNDPRGLLRASSKLYLSALPPHLRPRTLVTADPTLLVSHCREAGGPMVLKPLRGSLGKDVFLIRPENHANLQQVADVLTREGFAMAQEYIPEAREGDTRVLLLNGEPLQAEEYVAAVRRIPGGGDFRSNVHIGGRPAPGFYDAQARACAEAIGPRLREDGIMLAGLDVIGGKVVEINVFSPGGIPDAGELLSTDFVPAVLDAFEAAA